MRRKTMKIEILEVREAAANEALHTPSEVARLLRDEAKADRECFWVLHLNAGNRIIEKELVAVGIAQSSLVHPREVFKKAILNGSTAIITVHNHPSGSINPSPEDRAIWERLDKTGEIIGIKVHDHLIVTPQGDHYAAKEI